MIKLLIVIAIILAISFALDKFNILSFYSQLTKLGPIFTFGSLGILIIFILVNGVPELTPSLFSLNYSSTNVSMMPAILTTLVVVLISLLIATPIGIFTAIYLVEYADPNSKVVEVIRLATETLQGIPSIVYGLFGMIFFVGMFSRNFGFSYSILAGVGTVSIMVLPIIIRSVEESLIAVPRSVRDASFALGAGKLRTIFKIVLPMAMPGIISAIVLATGRIVGETAALQFTLGTATNLPTNLTNSARTLSLHLYILSSEGLYTGQAYATATILLIVVLIINFISTYLGNKVTDISEKN